MISDEIAYVFLSGIRYWGNLVAANRESNTDNGTHNIPGLLALRERSGSEVAIAAAPDERISARHFAFDERRCEASGERGRTPVPTPLAANATVSTTPPTIAASISTRLIPFQCWSSSRIASCPTR